MILGRNNFREPLSTADKAQFTYGDFLVVFVSFLLLAQAALFIVKNIEEFTDVEAAGAQGNRECNHCRSFIPP